MNHVYKLRLFETWLIQREKLNWINHSGPLTKLDMEGTALTGSFMLTAHHPHSTILAPRKLSRRLWQGRPLQRKAVSLASAFWALEQALNRCFSLISATRGPADQPLDTTSSPPQWRGWWRASPATTGAKASAASLAMWSVGRLPSYAGLAPSAGDPNSNFGTNDGSWIMSGGRCTTTTSRTG
jgi:hypothetical protein